MTTLTEDDVLEQLDAQNNLLSFMTTAHSILLQGIKRFLPSLFVDNDEEIVQQITRDQVIVVPAPGRSARLPFWRGEGVGRPAELGERIGDFIHTMSDDNAERRLSPRLRDDNVLSNIKGLIDDQKKATGVLPWSRHLVLERCRDEMGDWRVILH
uniref:MltR family transcriptional regulator n=1 Tax=Citrobacter amalonaticus TaxID=35703 RepID=UPI0006D5474E